MLIHSCMESSKDCCKRGTVALNFVWQLIFFVFFKIMQCLMMDAAHLQYCQYLLNMLFVVMLVLSTLD